MEDVGDYCVIENQNTGELLISNKNTLVFRDVVPDQRYPDKKEILNWSPVFNYNPFDKLDYK